MKFVLRISYCVFRNLFLQPKYAIRDTQYNKLKEGKSLKFCFDHQYLLLSIMEQIIAIVCGAMLASSFYLLMRRSLLRFVIGLILLSNGVNLVIFTMGRLTRYQPPVIPKGAKVPPEPFANPLPQALILTAIVISFGLLAFTLVLVYRHFAASRSIESDDIQASEPTEPLEVDEAAKRLPA